MTIMAISKWPSNAELIADAASLGYIYGHVLDPTYGHGTFWKKHRPEQLVGCDLDSAKSPVGAPIDFTAMPWDDRSFDCVVFDPPYKLNGTPTATVDERYGVEVPIRWQQRMSLIRDGVRECARVLGGGYLLVKCQDQVCSGKMRWQTLEVARWAEECGLGLVDRFTFLSYRPQPSGVRQVTARHGYSSLLVFKRGWGLTERSYR